MILDERLILNEDDLGDAEFSADDLNDATDDILNTSNIDWKKEIEAAGNDEKTLANIWSDFFSETFGNANVENVANLGKAVRIECMVLGFKQDINPFIEFIKLLLSKKILNNSNIKSPQYNVIHNSYDGQSYSDGYISSADLRENGNLRGNNLIFNAALYKQTPEDMKSYLFLQKKVLTKFNNNAEIEIKRAGEADSKKYLIDNYIKEVFLNGEELKPIEDIKVSLGKDGIYSKDDDNQQVYKDTNDKVIDRLAKQILGICKNDSAIAIFFLISKFGAAAERDGFNSAEAFKPISSKFNSSANADIVAAQLIDLDKKLFSSNAKMSAKVLEALIKRINELVPVK